jgi:hypothetical protein
VRGISRLGKIWIDIYLCMSRDANISKNWRDKESMSLRRSKTVLERGPSKDLVTVKVL